MRSRKRFHWSLWSKYKQIKQSLLVQTMTTSGPVYYRNSSGIFSQLNLADPIFPFEGRQTQTSFWIIGDLIQLITVMIEIAHVKMFRLTFHVFFSIHRSSNPCLPHRLHKLKSIIIYFAGYSLSLDSCDSSGVPNINNCDNRQAHYILFNGP